MPADHPDRRAGRGRLAPLLVALALAVTLGLAYAGKVVCVDGERGFWELTRYCYSDVIVLWSHRGYDVGAVPYAEPPPGYRVDYTTEYPPGLAFPAWLIALVTETRRGFFDLHALTFAASAAAALWWLDVALRGRGRGSRWRLLGFALSPGLVLFGMQNWDLWPVALVSAGLAAAATRRPVLAGVLFGVGAAVKWWPALLVVLVVAGAWRPGDPPGARTPAPLRSLAQRAGVDLRPAIAGGLAWAALQVPALLVSPRGWLEALVFHLRRRPNFDSTAAALGEAGSHLAPGRFWGEPFAHLWTAVSLAVLVVGIGYVLVRLRDGTLHPGDAALAVVGIFLVTGKVFSPQFVLWLLPVAVVATVRWTPVLAVEAANAGVWLLYGPWMARWQEGPEWWGLLYAAQGLSVVRTLALVWLVAAALARPRAVKASTTPAAPSPSPAEPPAARPTAG